MVMMRKPVFGLVFTLALLCPSENCPQMSCVGVLACRAVIRVMWGRPAGFTVAMRPTLASGSNSLRSCSSKRVTVCLMRILP